MSVDIIVVVVERPSLSVDIIVVVVERPSLSVDIIVVVVERPSLSVDIIVVVVERPSLSVDIIVVIVGRPSVSVDIIVVVVERPSLSVDIIVVVIVVVERPSLGNPAKVELAQEKYVACLREYEIHRRPKGSNFLAKLLMKLTELRTLSIEHSDMLFSLKVEKGSLPPLLSEYFDIDERK